MGKMKQLIKNRKKTANRLFTKIILFIGVKLIMSTFFVIESSHNCFNQTYLKTN